MVKEGRGKSRVKGRKEERDNESRLQEGRLDFF